MELLARFSWAFCPGESNIENDIYVSQVLNEKLKSFIKSGGITEYRILNAETCLLPQAVIGPGIQLVQCSLFIAYKSAEQ